MVLDWHDAHDGSPAQTGYLDGRLVAQVAYYDVVGGAGPGWVGYLRGERVTGRCIGAPVARASVERHVGRLEAVPHPEAP